MDVSPPRYGCSCQPTFWNFVRILGYSQAISHGEMRCLRLYTQHIHLTSMLYIYKVFNNLYMLWMCIWMSPHHVMVAHADLAFGILREIWATPRQYVMVKCSDWGCTPNPYSSHINAIYIKGVWQPLYAVDVHMDVSPPSYGCSCRPSFWNYARYMGDSQAISDGEMQWLRLYAQPIFISHQIYI